MKKTILHGIGMIKRFEETEVLHGIDIDVYTGDFTVIMGSSGSGKTTLLYALSGMDRLSEGSVFYREKEITKASEKELESLRAGEFGFVFQRTHLVSNLTLEENIRMAGLICVSMSEQETRERTAELIDRRSEEIKRTKCPLDPVRSFVDDTAEKIPKLQKRRRHYAAEESQF